MQCIYIFTTKEAEIVGNSRQSSSVANSVGSFLMVPHKSSSCLWLFPFPPYDNFKDPTSLFLQVPQIQLTMTRQHTQFPLTFVYSLAPRPQTLHEIPTLHRDIIVQRAFLKFITLFLVLTFQIVYQYLTLEST